MNTEAAGSAPDEDLAISTDVVHSTLRFLRMLNHRKRYIIAALLVTSALGVFYYLKKTPLYEAAAAILVTQTSPDVWNAASVANQQVDRSGPTYVRLFKSTPVLTGAANQLAKMPPQARVDLAQQPREDWIGVLSEHLDAGLIRNTNIIELTYRSKAPQAAEAVVAAIVDSYMDFMKKNHQDISVELLEVLNKEHQQVQTQLAQKKLRELDLRRAAGDLGLTNEETVHPVVQRVVSLNQSLIEVQKARLQLEAGLTAIRRAIREGGDLRQALIHIEPEAGKKLNMHVLGLDTDASAVAGSIQKKLLEDHAELLVKQTQYGPTHPQIQQLQQNIRSAEEYLKAYEAKLSGTSNNAQADNLGPILLSMVQEKLAQAWSHEGQLNQQYKAAEAEAIQLNDQMAELYMVKNEVERLQRHQDMLLDRMSNLDLDRDRVSLRVDIVHEPKASPFPVSPQMSKTILVCLIGGLGLGAGLAFVVDSLDDRFRSPEELSEQISAPILAMIGKLPTTGNEGAATLQVHTQPGAVQSEAFRTLRTTLAFAGEDTQRVAVTSSEPSDGKTTVIANLATSYAQTDKRTLLIDCDLRKPGLSKLFQLRRLRGLSDLLRSSDELPTMCRELIQPTGIEGLEILPCGPKPADPSELLSSSRMVELIGWAETTYDQILIDCPPVLAASDAAIIGRLVDGMILVVRPEQNHRRLVLRAAETLSTLGANLIGIVANRVGETGAGYYGYGHAYGYGYGYGYGHGEDEDESDDAAADSDGGASTTSPRHAA